MQSGTLFQPSHNDDVCLKFAVQMTKNGDKGEGVPYKSLRCQDVKKCLERPKVPKMARKCPELANLKKS